MRYRTIVADPPWPIQDFPEWGEARGFVPCPYPTMSLAAIRSLPVSELVAPEAHLYLWTTAGFLRESYAVAEAWGFEPMYPLVWCKEPRGEGMGGKFASNVEFVLFCRERHGSVAMTSFLADAAERAGLTARDVNRAMGTSDMAGWWLSRLPRRSRIPMTEQWFALKSLLAFDDRYDEDVRLVNEYRGDGLRCDTRWWNWPRGKHSQKPEAFLGGFGEKNSADRGRLVHDDLQMPEVRRRRDATSGTQEALLRDGLQVPLLREGACS